MLEFLFGGRDIELYVLAKVRADHSVGRERADRVVDPFLAFECQGLGGRVPLGLLREAHLHPDPLELLQRQHLIRVASRQAIRRVTQHHLKRSLGGAVTQSLKRRNVSSLTIAGTGISVQFSAG